MSVLNDGYGGFLILLLAGFFAHEPWRLLGLILSRDLSIESPVFVWVRAVSTALVAGLVTRLVLFPSGALVDVPLNHRLGAFAAGLACFFLLGRTLLAGTCGGVAALLAIRYALG
jgi:branched-subunit amino acid transport protein